MEARQLVLLSSDTVENQRDLQIAVGAVHHCTSVYGATVCSSLAKLSMEVLAEARKTKEFPAYFYSAWNPQRTAEMIGKCQVQGDADAQSISQESNIPCYLLENQPDSESENEYRARIMQATQNLPDGCNLVILPGCVIETILECMQVAGPPAVFSHWNIREKTLTLVSSADSFETLQTQLNIQIEVPNPPEPMHIVSQAMIEQPKEEAKESQQTDPQIVAQLKAINEWKVTVEEWKIALEERLKAQAEELQRKSQEAEAWKATATRQKALLEGLDRRTANLEASLQVLKTELNQRVQGLAEQQNKGLEEAKTEQEKRLADLNLRCQQIDASVKDLRTDLQPKQPVQPIAEAKVEERKPAAKAEEQGQAMAFTIQTAELKGDGRWYASVVATQPCAGYLCVSQQETMLGYTPQPLNFSTVSMEIDISAFCALEPGQQYQLFVLTDGQKASNEYDVLIPSFKRNFEDTLIFKHCGNVQEIEQYLLGSHGEVGVQLFRRLAGEWSNEDYGLMESFVQVMCQGNCDEGAIRVGMAAAGIQLSK